jgi:outer membrane cobalamin receptor
MTPALSSSVRTTRFCPRVMSMLLAVPAILIVVAHAAAQGPGPRLDGRVVDPDGRPVAGARVVLSGAAAAPVAALTDEDGRYAIALPAPGTMVVRASAPGLVGDAQRVVIDANGRSLDLTLRVSAVSETLVVTAAQVEVPLSQTADSVTVIDGGDLERRQVHTLGEALRAVPGLTVAQTGGPGTLTSLFPRGGESDFTLVLVDGVRANGFGGGIDLSQVPLEDIDRVEVVRSPQSALYGADAIGGVVQIITRRGGAPSARARLEGGSRETRRAAVATTGELSGWSWSASADRYEDAGFTGLAPASGETVSNDDAYQAQVGGTIGWRHARGTDVRGAARWVATDRGAPGPYGTNPMGHFSGVDRVSRGETDRRSVAVRVVQPWFGAASRVRQRVEFDVADYDLDFESAFGRSESSTRRLHGRLQTDAALSSWLGLSGGVEWLSERARSTFITAGTLEVPIERRVIGTFGEARWHAGDRVSVTAGLRAEHIQRDQLAGDPSPFSPRPDFDTDRVVSVNPKVAAAWLVSKRSPADGARAWTRVRVAAGTGIRPPDAFEVAFTDNPNLRPERSRSLEAGVTQALAGGAVQIEGTAFANEYDDLIIPVGRFRDASQYRTDNISNARARGLELGASLRAGRGLDLRASYTFLDTEILAVDLASDAPPPFVVGDRLLRRPRHQASVNAGWTADRVSLFASAHLRGDTLDVEPSFGAFGGLFPNRGYRTTAAGGSVRVGRGLTAYARVENLFNRAYEDVFGFPSPGRTAYVGVRVATSR